DGHDGGKRENEYRSSRSYNRYAVRSSAQGRHRPGPWANPTNKALFHFRERPKDRIRILLTERSPSLLAPRFSAFSNRSRHSSKQLTDDTASLSRDRLSSACNIRPDNVVFRLLASTFRRALCAAGTLI